jgi:hypothetical protein
LVRLKHPVSRRAGDTFTIARSRLFEKIGRVNTRQADPVLLERKLFESCFGWLLPEKRPRTRSNQKKADSNAIA